VGYTYHPMAIGDYDEIYALWENAPGVGLSGADARDSIESYLLRNPGQSFVCKADGYIVGTILCGNDGRRSYIHHTAVAAEHRRHGIATELVRLALDAQRECGIQKCHLFVVTENDSGKAFWREIGFDKRYDIDIMSKEL